MSTSPQCNHEEMFYIFIHWYLRNILDPVLLVGFKGHQLLKVAPHPQCQRPSPSDHLKESYLSDAFGTDGPDNWCGFQVKGEEKRKRPPSRL